MDFADGRGRAAIPIGVLALTIGCRFNARRRNSCLRFHIAAERTPLCLLHTREIVMHAARSLLLLLICVVCPGLLAPAAAADKPMP
jgi:hypothetical protein